MKLTPKNKAIIDAKDYEGLLRDVRFLPAGDPWFAEETGVYYGKRMRQLRSQPGGDDLHVRCSKRIGWER
jgi:hypothetical protein